MEVDGGGQLMQMDLGMTMSRDALVAAHPLHWAPDTQQYKPTQLSDFLPRLSDTDFNPKHTSMIVNNLHIIVDD